jgi:hypothetical protein
MPAGPVVVGIYLVTGVAVAALVAWRLAHQRRAARAQGPPASPPRATEGDAIDAFWSWWQSVRGALAQAIDDRKVDAWAEPLAKHVRAIDPGLAWELGPGE